jgi:hypothetical protein
MTGQWIGSYTGTSTGKIIVNIDELSSCYQGIAFLHDDNVNVPITVANFKTRPQQVRIRYGLWAAPFGAFDVVASNTITPQELGRRRTTLTGWLKICFAINPTASVSQSSDQYIVWHLFKVLPW